MVTPEMLLFLAGKMGLPNPVVEQGECCYVEAPGVWRVFNPSTDDAQFGRLVVWAAMNGYLLSHHYHDRYDVAVYKNERWRFTECDIADPTTPDSIRAAAVVAICRALGYQEAANGPSV